MSSLRDIESLILLLYFAQHIWEGTWETELGATRYQLGSSGRLGHSLGLERIRNGIGREISTSSSYHIMARQKSAFWLDFEAWDVWSQGCARCYAVWSGSLKSVGLDALPPLANASGFK